MRPTSIGSCGLRLATLLLLAASVPAQTTYFVDAAQTSCPGSGTPTDPFCSIQTAIATSVTGDTIIVRPGLYAENLDFLGKDITVRAETGYFETFIDGSGNGSVVRFVSGEGPGAILQGFKIFNGGFVDEGGGIFCVDSSPTIRNCFITDNRARQRGGGLYARGSSIRLEAASISLNFVTHETTPGSGGGGACFDGGQPTLDDCDLLLNRSVQKGGGILALDTDLELFECHVSANVAGRWSQGHGIGAGICQLGGTLEILSGTMLRNDLYGASASGACIYSDGELSVRDSILGDNIIRVQSPMDATLALGGAVHVAGSASLTDNDIASNEIRARAVFRPEAYGGGVSFAGTSLTMERNRIRENTIRCRAVSPGSTTLAGGGGLYLAGPATVRDNEIRLNRVSSQGRDSGRAFGGGAFVAGDVHWIGGELFSNRADGAGPTFGAGRGGGLHVVGRATVINTTIAFNSASSSSPADGSQGGGIHTDPVADLTLAHVTIANNDVFRDTQNPRAGGLYGPGARVVNSILWSNRGDEIQQATDVTFSDVEGGYPGHGNINSPPFFESILDFDYRISCISACVDAGTASPGVPLPELDGSGLDLRLIGPPDMGADEVGVSWALNGVPSAGGAPIDFEASAPLGHPTPSIAEVYLSTSLGNGGPVPLAGGRQLPILIDSFLQLWLAQPSAIRQAPLSGCGGGTTTPFSIPASTPVGFRVYYAGVAWDVGAARATSVSEAASFFVQ
ncbi:MAG: hypothetical protein RL885_19280 [Planctomycetota bacterium]